MAPNSAKIVFWRCFAEFRDVEAGEAPRRVGHQHARIAFATFARFEEKGEAVGPNKYKYRHDFLLFNYSHDIDIHPRASLFLLHYNHTSTSSISNHSTMAHPDIFYRPMKGETSGLPHDPFKSFVIPRPIGWISTTSQDGKDNLAPFSQFMNVSFDPPTIL